MKLTQSQLRRIIKEELGKVLSEGENSFDKELIDHLFYDVKDMTDGETLESVYNDVMGRRELGDDGMQDDEMLMNYLPEEIKLAIEHIATMPEEG